MSRPSLPRSLPVIGAPLEEVARVVRQAQLETQTFLKWLSGSTAMRSHVLLDTNALAVSTSVTSTVPWLTFSLADPGTWLIHARGRYSTAAAGTGLRHAFDFTGEIDRAVLQLVHFTAAAGTHSTDSTTSRNTLIGGAAAGSVTVQPFELFGFVRTRDAGTLSLLFASGVAASAVTISAGAFAEVKRA